MRPATAPLRLTDGQREILEKLAVARAAPHREVTRARALLLAGDGVATTAVAQAVGASPASVTAWRERFAAEGLANFGKVSAGRGRRPSISAEKVAAIVHATLRDRPPGETHWSCRTMARAQGVSPATVQRIWSARGLAPHRVKTFNQALDRTQPTLPMKKGRAGTMTHDYKRNGTTTLFAALDVLSGTVIGQCYPKHRNGEFLKFLRTIDRQVPRGLPVHMILDNYGTHKHPNVQAWLDKHPRFHLHFTPTSSSWLNLVERWFRNLTDKAIRRGVFKSVPELITAIEAYLQASNDDPRPFIWTATAEEILEKVRRGRVTLNSITT